MENLLKGGWRISSRKGEDFCDFNKHFQAIYSDQISKFSPTIVDSRNIQLLLVPIIKCIKNKNVCIKHKKLNLWKKYPFASTICHKIGGLKNHQSGGNLKRGAGIFWKGGFRPHRTLWCSPIFLLSKMVICLSIIQTFCFQSTFVKAVSQNIGKIKLCRKNWSFLA